MRAVDGRGGILPRPVVAPHCLGRPLVLAAYFCLPVLAYFVCCMSTTLVTDLVWYPHSVWISEGFDGELRMRGWRWAS